MINKVILIGRVTQAPKKYLTGKEPFIPFTFLNIAVSKKTKNQNGEMVENTEFIEISCFRKLAEFITNYVNVGDLVIVEGHIKTRKKYNEYIRKNENSTEIIGDSIKTLAKSKKENKQENTETKEEKTDDFKQIGFKESIKTDDIEFTEDDLPF
jgi:single-strand DNA-binding protein